MNCWSQISVMYSIAKQSFVKADMLAWGDFLFEKSKLFANNNMTAPP